MTLRAEALAGLSDALLKALKAQAHYAQDHPQVQQSLEEAHACLRDLLRSESPLALRAGGGALAVQGQPLPPETPSAQALAREMEQRGIDSLVFQEGVDPDELQLLFFLLQLRPRRLEEMGGARSLLPMDGHLRVLEAHEEPARAPEPEPDFLPPPPDLMGPEDLVETLSPLVLAEELRARLARLIQSTAASPSRTLHMPWTSEHREVMKRHGLRVPDFEGMEGAGEELGLGALDPVTLRDTLRTALSLMSPLDQGSVLLGTATFPGTEQALRRALDYLAPELLAQVAAHAHITAKPSRFELALLVASLLQCVKDRELSLEALRGRLQFEGWGLHEVDQLREAILWECQGTDTKMNQALADRSVFELAPQQVMILLRQVLHGKRHGALRDLLAQLEVGLGSPLPERRRLSAEITADLAECLEVPGLPVDAEDLLHRMLREHLERENDLQAALWTAQGLESVLAYWIRTGRLQLVYSELLALGGLTFRPETTPEKRKSIKDLVSRVGSPINLAALVPLLHETATPIAMHQLHSLFALLGRPAAQYLAVALDLEEHSPRAARLMAALRAVGKPSVPALLELLGSARPDTVFHALSILSDVATPEVVPRIIPLLDHPEDQVRSSALAALARLGGPEAAAALGAFFPEAPAVLQLECLEALALLKSPASVKVLTDFLAGGRGADVVGARVRLRAVETLGALGSPVAITALAEVFRKKGFLGSRESTGMRLAAAKALGAIPGRESREALSMALDAEKDDEVRSAIRQLLVGKGA